MNRIILVAFILLCGNDLTAHNNDWENHHVLSINREKARRTIWRIEEFDLTKKIKWLIMQ